MGRGGLPVDEEDEGKDKDVNYGNDLGFFQPAMALVVKATSRIHTSLGGGVFRPARPIDAANRGIDRPGALVLRPGEKRKKNVDVANSGKDRKKKAKQLVKKMTRVDAEKAWDEALKNVTDPRLVIACADFLAEVSTKHTSEFLKANLRKGIVARPWVYEALALVLESESSGALHEEIDRVRTSMVDLAPQDAAGWLAAAKAMAEHGNTKRALAFCRQAAQLQPNAPHSFEQALVYAEKAKDPRAMKWAAGNLLRKDWPVDNQRLQLKAQAKLDALARTLKAAKRKRDALQMVRAVSKLKQRDLVIRLTWGAGQSGPADLDLEVKEPTNSVCSCLHRQTPGGGTLIGDTVSERNRETYVAAEAFSGEYQISLRRIWGRPLGSKAKVVIIRHQGTEDETRTEEVIRFDRKYTFKIKLKGGRRKTVAAVPPPVVHKQPPTKQGMSETTRVLTKLRDLASPEFGGGAASRTSGGIGSFGGANVPPPGAAPLNRTQPEELAFETRVSPFLLNGADLTAQASVSADRKYIRLTMNPVYQTVGAGGNGSQVNLPLIPGGTNP
jgi:hypothetical protein